MSASSEDFNRSVLLNSTNTHYEDLKFRPNAFQLLTPPEGSKPKRKCSDQDETPTKRGRFCNQEQESQDVSSNDVEMLDMAAVKRRVRRRQTVFGMMNATSIAGPSRPCRSLLSTLPILQSFVSSNKSDVFKCHSTSVNSFVTPPYACAYSHTAKSGGTPLIAVATEQGSVLVLNTSRREDWDFEPQRAVLEPHDNGIFDVKWNFDDSLLVTTSGDKSSRISCIETQSILHILQGHTSTVKCAAWDPSHKDILSTGGRDGSICLWDLRVNNQTVEDDISVITPVMSILAAHGQEKAKGGRRKLNPLPRSVTNLIYPDGQPYSLVSSGAFDGILHSWDVRAWSMQNSQSPKKTKSGPIPQYSSSLDPTTLNGSRRPRGITSLTNGSGPTAGLLFALGADSHLHTYSQSLMHLASDTHPNMHTNSFYVRLATSPCGRWLASGSAGKSGTFFMCDISNAGRISASPRATGFSEPTSKIVEFRGQTSEIGAVDWAAEMVATCADDGTVRVWRPNVEVYRQCVSDPEEQGWQWSWSSTDYS
ncbi:WD40-repeat-containing domain protein [Hygrophoropsis aurantiaca]|uniref:WD40-repeat-containing domain protein n=1 Tax=Hygrophoropsis aurantiaca TaxID=72124 RepID=A0ACB8AT85_9AGAM|nr:WD40-repeat-containing domain protein [Hygrophoropsis aurantiaca]